MRVWVGDLTNALRNRNGVWEILVNIASQRRPLSSTGLTIELRDLYYDPGQSCRNGSGKLCLSIIALLKRSGEAKDGEPHMKPNRKMALTANFW